MDDKRLNENGEQPNEEMNQNEQPVQNEQPSESSGSGWVFSDKNVSGSGQEEAQWAGGVFHKEETTSGEQPNEEGWYHSGPKSSRKTPRATTAVTAMATTVPSRMPLSRISTQRKAKATNGIMRIIRQSQNIHPPKTNRTRGCGCSPSLCVPSCVPVSSALPVMEPMH